MYFGGNRRWVPLNIEHTEHNEFVVRCARSLKCNNVKVLSRLSLIFRVNVVMNRTVVVDSDWRFNFHSKIAIYNSLRVVVLLEERKDNKGIESQMELREKKDEKYVNKKQEKGQWKTGLPFYKPLYLENSPVLGNGKSLAHLCSLLLSDIFGKWLISFFIYFSFYLFLQFLADT